MADGKEILVVGFFMAFVVSSLLGLWLLFIMSNKWDDH